MALHGCEDQHEKIRHNIVEFVESHKDVFRKFLMSPCMEDHIESMKKCGTWATQLEVSAAATLFQIPIYVCTQRSGSPTYYWELYQPQVPENKSAILSHIELAHVSRCHCELINMISGGQPVVVPKLHNIKAFVDLT